MYGTYGIDTECQVFALYAHKDFSLGSGILKSTNVFTEAHEEVVAYCGTKTSLAGAGTHPAL